MRILHINLALVGIGRYGIGMGKALAEVLGAKVCSVFNASLLHEEGMQDEQTLNFPYKAYSMASPSQQLAAAGRILVWARKFAPDVIHVSSGSVGPFGIKLILWPLLARLAPLVITEHDPAPHSGVDASWSARVGRWWVRYWTRHFVVHGPQCRNMLLRQGINESRISLGRHGIFAPAACSNHEQQQRDSQCILFFGALRPNKGIELLLSIADTVVQNCPQARFVVAGSSAFGRELQDSQWPARLQNMLGQMRSRPYFEVHERFVPDDEVEALFARAEITLMPYLDATQSGVAMLAMPRGSTVVATNVGDFADIITHGHTGMLCPPQADAMAQALINLLQHPQKSRRLAEAARSFALQELSWQAIVRQRLLPVYRQLAGEK